MGRICEAGIVAHFYLIESLGRVEIGARIVMAGREARHAVTVSRARVGDTIVVGNGAGIVVTGTVTTADAAELALDAETVTTTERPAPAIWLAQALAKGDRDELAVQAAAELGVDGVIPWAAQRSIVKWDGQRAVKGHARWSAVVREATKQSMRSWLPVAAPLATTTQLAARTASARLVVLDPGSDLRLTREASAWSGDDTRDTVIVVGPEGGVSPQELDQLAAAGAVIVRLGESVLRTSTAGPAAIAVLNTVLGRW